FQGNKQLSNLLLDPAFSKEIKETLDAARQLVSYGALNGIPLPGLSNSLTYFDAYTSGRLPLNLIQAQRDYFGSHTYERTDKDGIFHTEWEA
ncbi:MAG: NADP-dependent phosphogluconate dehydrogenase, partial [Muriicola sp.]